MKICAITMVHRDYWALSQWYRHFARHLGAENLYVVAHGHDPEIERLCPDANVMTIPRDDLDHFDIRRETLLNWLQAELGETHDWVIRTDADELICLDPAQHPDFASLLSAQTSDALFALGLELAQVDGDAPCAPVQNVLRERSCAVFSPNYSKAWASRGPVGLRQHGLELEWQDLRKKPIALPRGVYLLHLKYADTDALTRSFPVRREVANAPGTGLPGWAWKHPHGTLRRFQRLVQNLDETPWPEAETRAYELYPTNPMRLRARKVLRISRDHPKMRVRLPDWFRDA